MPDLKFAEIFATAEKALNTTQTRSVDHIFQKIGAFPSSLIILKTWIWMLWNIFQVKCLWNVVYSYFYKMHGIKIWQWYKWLYRLQNNRCYSQLNGAIVLGTCGCRETMGYCLTNSGCKSMIHIGDPNGNISTPTRGGGYFTKRLNSKGGICFWMSTINLWLIVL